MSTSALTGHVLLLGSSQEPDVLVADAATGGQLYVFKQNRAARSGSAAIARSGHVAVAQAGKLAVHLLAWGKDVPAFKCHVAEPMGPLVATKCGNFLFAGGHSGKVYVWDVKTGELVLVFDAHYKAVSALALTSDDSHLVTAGEDAVVHVWRLVDILDEPDVSSSFQQGLLPMRSFTEHALPVTDLHVGRGGVNARIYTASLDRTCKIWSLNSSQSLFSVSCPSHVNACVADAMEYRLFMGCGDGKVYTLDLNAAASSVTAAHARLAAAGENGQVWEANGGARLPDAFEGHEGEITVLRVDATGAFLISGDDRGAVRVWDALSRQSLRTLQFFKGRVSSLELLPKPANLFHQTKNSKSELPIAPLKKYMGGGASN